jgi:hypothetical protein
VVCAATCSPTPVAKSWFHYIGDQLTALREAGKPLIAERGAHSAKYQQNISKISTKYQAAPR